MKRFIHPLYMAYTKALEIIVSKKFLLVLLSAYLLINGFLTGTEFLPIVLAGLGIQGFLDTKTTARTFHEQDSSETSIGAAVG